MVQPVKLDETNNLNFPQKSYSFTHCFFHLFYWLQNCKNILLTIRIHWKHKTCRKFIHYLLYHHMHIMSNPKIFTIPKYFFFFPSTNVSFCVFELFNDKASNIYTISNKWLQLRDNIFQSEFRFIVGVWV